MKLKTTFRYVAWDSDGQCWSYELRPVKYDNEEWSLDGLYRTDVNCEYHLTDECPTDWNDRVYDTESEEDMKLLQALMEL